MSLRALASVVLISFIALAGFGLLMPTMGHDGHEMGCPFAPGGAAICAAPLVHLKHWQSAFTTILTEVSVLVSALVFLGLPFVIPKFEPQYERYRLYRRAPVRPPLLQELFARGILNPKAP